MGHLVEWFPSFLSDGAGVDLPPGPPVDEDPAGAWRNLYDEVLALLEDPATSGRVLSNPHIGEVPLPQAVSQFFTGDVFQHTWDLARASGQDATLDPERCAAMLAGAEPYEDAMRQQWAVRPTSRGPGGCGCPDEAARVHRARSLLGPRFVCGLTGRPTLRYSDESPRAHLG